MKSQAERLIVHARTMDGGTLPMFLEKVQVKVTKRKPESDRSTCYESSTREVRGL